MILVDLQFTFKSAKRLYGLIVSYARSNQTWDCAQNNDDHFKTLNNSCESDITQPFFAMNSFCYKSSYPGLFFRKVRGGTLRACICKLVDAIPFLFMSFLKIIVK